MRYARLRPLLARARRPRAVPDARCAGRSGGAACVLRRTFGGVPLVDMACLPPHDLVLPLASAPMALGLSPDDVPPPRPASWQRRNGPTIGVALAPSPWGRVAETIPEQIVATLRQAFPDRRLVALDDAAPRRPAVGQWTPILSRLPALSLSSLPMVPRLMPPVSPAHRSGCCSTAHRIGCGGAAGSSAAVHPTARPLSR